MGSFFIAFRKLEQFLFEPVVSERDRAGVIQAFEFTYEQCWKGFQKAASDQGLDAKSPRQAIQAAFQLGWTLPAEESSWYCSSFSNDPPQPRDIPVFA